jgi:alpha-beta hydrolase superfamily lysophospholipase
MKVLYLHGWNSEVGGVKPTYLRSHGHDVCEPSVDHDDFEVALRTAQAAFDQYQPGVVVGSSRGGAVALNLKSGSARVVLLCPAWKKWGAVKTAKPGTTIIHSRADDVVPFADSLELLSKSGLPESALIEVGQDHRLADPQTLEALLRAVEGRYESP